MTEGEEFIEDYFLSEKIKYRKELPINGLKNDTKNYRVADFYLPDYKIYVEYFGQWGVDLQKERYRQKKQVYIINQIPCVILYPENLGIIEYIFEKRIIYVLKRYKLEKELKKYRIKLFRKERNSSIPFIVFALFAIAVSYPWHKDRLWLFAGIVIILYQIYLMYRSFKQIFND